MTSQVSSDASSILAALRAAGLRLWLDQTPDGLRPMCAPPFVQLTQEQQASISEHRAELIVILLAELRAESREDPRAADRAIGWGR